MKPIEWTDDEREAVINAMYGNGRVVPHSPADILDALAPFVAERERQAAARALYRASNVAKRRESGDVSWLTLRAMAWKTITTRGGLAATDWKEGKP